MAKRVRMASDTTGWPVLEERRPILRGPRPAARPARSRSVWLLPVLAFVCGGLVSAAVFTIGWRHQTQQNTAAESALARETARNHTLSASLAAARRAATHARRNAAHERQIAAQRAAEATAAANRLAGAAASMASEASAARAAAGPITAGAGSVSAGAAKIANELRNLTTYLTTTPPRQIDAGYVESQATYLQRQLGQLQTSGANVGSAVASLQAAVEKLRRYASSL